MDLTLLEQFAVGNTVVVVADSSINAEFNGLRTYGMSGCVRMIDYKAGVCVSLFISRAFEPCFWYQPGCLALSTDPMPFVPLIAAQIEVALGGGPGQVTLQRNSIITGCLRSWLISKANAKPGQSLFQFISKMTWEECIAVYQGGNGMLAAWLKANDTRVRRAQMTEATTDVTTYEQFRGPLSAKRPKIG